MTGCPVLVIRPEPGNAVTVAAARAMGLQAIGAPLFRVEPVSWTPPDPARFDALLLGSANAVRCGGLALERLTRLPAYAVGQSTAEAARQAGFGVSAWGSGGIQELLPKLASDGRRNVLRLAGEDHMAVEALPGVRIETVVVYTVRSLPPPDVPLDLLRAGAIVLLHSAAAARYFAEECDRRGVARAAVALACLGPRIADAIGEGWRAVRAASRPDDTALLALAAEMCQGAGIGVGSNTIG